ncbi:MAG: PfkB family carbohydrate kinase, partial [Clostridia bacterium]|nr:PfkB family carbohydrate kinase [Clostridia bacterium]
MAKRILIVGSADMDICVPASRFPETGETLLQEGNVTYSPGGKGAGVAAAFAKMGGEAVFCARVGRDAHGETLYDYYRETGIDLAHLKIDKDNPTGTEVILTEPSGKKHVLRYPGANAFLREDDVENAFLTCPDALVMHLEPKAELVISAARCAFRHGIPVFLDAGGVKEDFPLSALPHLEVFTLNETETQRLTGIRPSGVDSCLQAVLELSKRVSAGYLVLKMGERGAFIYNGKHFW